MEPEILLMERSSISLEEDTNNLSLERHPGDGMEFSYTLDDHIRSATSSYNNMKQLNIQTRSKIKAKLQEHKIVKKDFSDKKGPDILSSSLQSEDKVNSYYSKSHQDLVVLVDSLKTQLQFSEDHNNQLIEEKMKLSQQLGIQTQVNNELKKLLVASIGEDLQEKYERLLLDKSQTDLEIKHLHNVLQEDREEVEQAMIQSDVWRTKFLASRVMSEELVKWKSALYYKYRESYLALEKLLEEHSKIRALNNATSRGLIKLAEHLQCKDPSLDSSLKLTTTIDVAFINNDLVNSFLEILNDRLKDKTIVISESQNNDKIEMKRLDVHKEKGKNMDRDVYKEPVELTDAEMLAHEVIVNTEIKTDEICRLRQDYLAHNRISHFLSTNYHVTFNCCENCRGAVIHV